VTKPLPPPTAGEPPSAPAGRAPRPRTGNARR
jgi:hypothetical protein